MAVPSPQQDTAPTSAPLAPFTYFTSRHEVSRIDAAMAEQFSDVFRKVDESADDDHTADFVWIHAANKQTERMAHNAAVCSHLSGIKCLEDKASLALLQREMRVPTLATYPVRGADGFRQWCEAHFGAGDESVVTDSATMGGSEADAASATLWIVKDAGANGAEDIWVFSAMCWRDVCSQMEQASAAAAPATGTGSRVRTYVVQEYVKRPLLWDGRFKFHLRVYALLTADMRCFLYRKAYAHVANMPFTTLPGEESATVQENGEQQRASSELFGREVHITNVSANIGNDALFHGTPIIDMPLDMPLPYARMQRLFTEVARCAAPYMRRQLSANHFQHMGCDIIIDEDGTPWLIEINAPPNMFSYTLDPEHPAELETHAMVKPQTHDLIAKFVLGPLLDAQSSSETVGQSVYDGAKATTRNFTQACSGVGRIHCGTADVLGLCPATHREEAGLDANPELVNGWEPVCDSAKAPDESFQASTCSDLPLNALYWASVCSKLRRLPVARAAE